MNGKFFILAIDGGGLKGLIAIKILQLIETIIGESISEKCDLLAGTSTGGLIVSALSTAGKNGEAKYDLQEIENMYVEVGQSVFKKGGLSLSGKENEKFESLLRETFGDTKLSQTIKPVFVPTYEIRQQKIIGFKTRAAKQNSTKDLSLVDVCRATSAIPPVFPTCILTYNNRVVHCVDAGLHLKNPALSALAEVLKHRTYYGVESEKDIVLLSISTGTYHSEKQDWSTDINSIINTQSHDMDYIATQKLKIDYSMINFLRVDLNLGGSPFSLMQLLEWMERIKALSENKAFHKDIRELLK